MSGIPKIEIIESVETLKSLMKKQKTGLAYAKVQALYLLKIKAVTTIRHLAVILGRGESTVHRWLHIYRTEGLKKLLEEPPKTGRGNKIGVEIVAQIQQELSEPKGFNSYQEVQLWLLTCQDIEIGYSTLHKIVRYELKGKLKVPRPSHTKQSPGVIQVFKDYLPIKLKGIIDDFRAKRSDKQKIAYWCQDETKLGFRTISGKKLTLKGVKPEQIIQWHYDYYYLYGLVEPMGGRSFFYELSHFNSKCFEKYLEKFAQQYAEEIHIIQLDNASVHTAKKLKLPDNVVLLFQPPYCPELNPIERVWEYLKYHLRSLWFSGLEDLKNQVANILNSLSEKIISSLTAWDYIVNALSLSLP